MTGVLWAAVAGVLFGVFQAVNRAALVDMDVYASTFIQLLVCSVFMVGALLIDDASAIGLLTVSAGANFAVAGLIHFLAGWTLLNLSQKKLGASRTSPLLSTTPLFGTAIAALTLDEVPGAIEMAGIVLIVVGVYLAQMDRAQVPTTVAPGSAGGAAVTGSAEAPPSTGSLERSVSTHPSTTGPPLWWSLFGLGAAFSWAVSPIFIRNGLDELNEPILGVTLGVVAATFAFGIALLIRGRPASILSASRSSLAWKAVAGVLVGIATWARWYSLTFTSVAIVLSLALLAVPTVLFLAPIFAGRHLERITVPVVVGSAFVVGGSLVLIAQG